MELRESEQVEFKLEMNLKAVKSVIAFANTNGGTLFVGVDDGGVAVGVGDIDTELTRITSMMRDSIKPDILMMASVEISQLEGVDVVAVHVGRGVKRPYYLASKGPRPEGVFVRSGAASVPASDTAILRMIQESESDSYELRRAMRQDLTFEYALGEFLKKGFAFGEGEMRTLGLADAEGSFTNLALLLSDQCPPTIKAASFSDDARNTFSERQEYSGSLLKQLAEAYAFLESHNHFRTEFKGLERIDHYDYPAVALREALVNSVAHREYALSGPTLVSVMPSSIEIVSLGGLPLGIEYEDLSARISMPRNRGLANILFRLELIEAYGTGIGRIRTSYEGSRAKPRIAVTANTFTVQLPNRNVSLEGTPSMAKEDDERVLDFLASGPRSRAEVQNMLGVSQATAVRILSELVGAGKALKKGAGKSTRYCLA